METLLNNPPPLGHPDRAAWNRRLDEALGQGAAAIAADAMAAKGEALRRGDTRAARVADAIERRAVMGREHLGRPDVEEVVG